MKVRHKSWSNPYDEKYRRKVMLEGMKRKDEIRENFEKYLNDSCGEYQKKIGKELMG